MDRDSGPHTLSNNSTVWLNVESLALLKPEYSGSVLNMYTTLCCRNYLYWDVVAILGWREKGLLGI